MHVYECVYVAPTGYVLTGRLDLGIEIDNSAGSLK